MSSELNELKTAWYRYNKQINSYLLVLPQENINSYDLVAKSLTAPVFDINKYQNADDSLEVFNEIVYKMAHYYFNVF